MQIGDITLTSGMLNNLVALQNTASLVNTTQEALSTGKKVNSAIDNPVEFFASQNMLSEANSLAGYGDGMSNMVQTIQAANSGITGITSLLQSAQSIAQSAIGVSAGTGFQTGQINLNSLVSGDKITVGGTAFTATTTYAVAGDFVIGANSDISAENLAGAINKAGIASITASSVQGSTVDIADTAADVNAGNLSFTAKTPATGANDASVNFVPANNQLASLTSQYQSIITQAEQMAQDSGFQGQNLLAGGAALTVSFTGDSSLSLNTYTATTAAGLGVAATATDGWAAAGDAQGDYNTISTAIGNLKNYSAGLSDNLAIITARQTFSTSMENVLQTGSGNLVNADTNEEGADMLMLQTQQSLGTTALSLASQSAQSVLKLFS